MVQVLSFRELGHRHVKLPLNNAPYWEAVENAETFSAEQRVDRSRMAGTLYIPLCNYSVHRQPGLGYRFALRHFTIHAEETVLFAY